MSKISNLLIVIPARGGSKRLPRKNIKPLHGKPMIGWTIEAACSSGLSSRIVVTSDDDEILNYASTYADRGVVSHKRPEELATDTASSIDVIIDVIEAERLAGKPPSTVLLLQPTSPLRNETDIRNAVEAFEKSGKRDSVVSVCEVDHPTAWVGKIDNNNQLVGIDLSVQRSQDHEREYRLNGAVYVVDVDFIMSARSLFTETLIASEMPRQRSVDIDEGIDFKVCESLLND
ncbi:cytidylyltransferase domain-containing protein [Idiomarina sp.]|uniref:acylneuraminate cytidylyltransferase family protein n=1 Tax=Idiomarina sp. TaxID=1874361 RepID=UPI002EA8689D|nr:acylneuraminate cytidylyltransferase family protein [Pseudomonadota bacterium]